MTANKFVVATVLAVCGLSIVSEAAFLEDARTKVGDVLDAAGEHVNDAQKKLTEKAKNVKDFVKDRVIQAQDAWDGSKSQRNRFRKEGERRILQDIPEDYQEYDDLYEKDAPQHWEDGENVNNNWQNVKDGLRRYWDNLKESVSDKYRDLRENADEDRNRYFSSNNNNNNNNNDAQRNEDSYSAEDDHDFNVDFNNARRRMKESVSSLADKAASARDFVAEKAKDAKNVILDEEIAHDKQNGNNNNINNFEGMSLKGKHVSQDIGAKVSGAKEYANNVINKFSNKASETKSTILDKASEYRDKLGETQEKLAEKARDMNRNVHSTNTDLNEDSPRYANTNRNNDILGEEDDVNNNNNQLRARRPYRLNRWHEEE